jgi:hypothetical protein
MSYALSKSSLKANDLPAHRAARPVVTDTGVVPADGQSVVYLLNLTLGCRVTVEGPDPDAFDVSDDTVALAFIVPGRYIITVAASDGGSTARLQIDATRPEDAPEADTPEDFIWQGLPAPKISRRP